ncbi:MAG: chemotaxis protein CheB [Luteolibacter sp.]
MTKGDKVPSGTRKTSKRVRQPADLKEAIETSLKVGRPFSIVGLGASAGGLEALEVFFKKMPVDSGLAFIVVQHLDPTHEDMLPDLLQRDTAMPVCRIEDRMKVVPNHVYVIPPNRDLSLLHGVLYLIEQVSGPGPRLPIDFFFRSLAEDWREWGIGVVLSGMGSDGTLGLRAIKEQCGAVFVQDPKSAKYDSMVQSAIHEGLADVIAPVEELPMQILDYVNLGFRPVFAVPEGAKEDSSDLEKIMILLRRQTGHDFSVYKRSTIWRRIERRMTLHHLTAMADYVRYLRENPQDLEILFKEMLIGVTEFFRDDLVWESLKNEVFPELIRSRPDGGVLRAWVAGCSTGEEAYSMAMVFLEAKENVKPNHRISLQIFATDLSEDAIERARCGVYPQGIVKNVSEERLQRFFTADSNHFRVSKEIREMVIFAHQNVVSDAPFTKLDLLSCRNLLIYFIADLQKKLLPLFHYCLNPKSVLVLGNAETVGNAGDLFIPLSSKARIYRRLETPVQAGIMRFPLVFKHPVGRLHPSHGMATSLAAPVMDLQVLANDFLLRHYTPVAALVTDTGDILYIHGKTGRFLEPAAGQANWNIFAMAKESLNHALFEAFHRAVRKKEVVTVKGLQMGTEDRETCVDITVHPIEEPSALLRMVLVVFSEIPVISTVGIKGHPKSGTAKSIELAEMTSNLRASQEELQVLREEMQTTGEELKSANEELQSTNEELQSMNEELTTSKEEMQAMNEELQVVNQDLMVKVRDLSRTNNDIKNLLSGTDIATLFLDSNINVRWFAPQMTDLINLVQSDIGRPITDLVSQLDYPDLAKDTREVLRTLIVKDREIPTHDGRWFAARIMPYRIDEKMIDGLVITFLNISERKNLASELDACKVRLLELQKNPPDKKG